MCPSVHVFMLLGAKKNFCIKVIKKINFILFCSEIMLFSYKNIVYIPAFCSFKVRMSTRPFTQVKVTFHNRLTTRTHWNFQLDNNIRQLFHIQHAIIYAVLQDLNILHIVIPNFCNCKQLITYYSRRDRDQVVSVVHIESFAPQRCWFESRQRLWNLSGEEAYNPAYGRSGVLSRCRSFLK